jgi:hypothetical protein
MKKNEIINQKIAENSKLIEDIVYQITTEYTKGLDEIMVNCRIIFNSNEKATNEELEDLLSQLPCALYFVASEGQEVIGIKQDIAQITRKENYNIAREKAVGTIADKNTTAEMQVINEAINEIIYERAYKMIRSKVEMAQEMINSLKRVFDARMSDLEISRGVRK